MKKLVRKLFFFSYENRIARLTLIIELLSKGHSLSTPYFVQKFGVTKTIYYSYLVSIIPKNRIFLF